MSPLTHGTINCRFQGMVEIFNHASGISGMFDCPDIKKNQHFLDIGGSWPANQHLLSAVAFRTPVSDSDFEMSTSTFHIFSKASVVDVDVCRGSPANVAGYGVSRLGERRIFVVTTWRNFRVAYGKSETFPVPVTTPATCATSPLQSFPYLFLLTPPFPSWVPWLVVLSGRWLNWKERQTFNLEVASSTLAVVDAYSWYGVFLPPRERSQSDSSQQAYITLIVRWMQGARPSRHCGDLGILSGHDWWLHRIY
ncbi:hypothetical protein DFH06DRAFT_1132541 [Mycena polygramma]|nr:hypothetical protein DFH06DRAFT_1132541 [Mycena polygramma]